MRETLTIVISGGQFRAFVHVLAPLDQALEDRNETFHTLVLELVFLLRAKTVVR